MLVFDRRELAHRNVGALYAGAHDLTRAKIPFVMLVTILAFRADVGNFVAHAGGHVEILATPSVSSQLLARGLRPHTAGEQLQLLGFARSAACDEHPALLWLDTQVHTAQDR